MSSLISDDVSCVRAIGVALGQLSRRMSGDAMMDDGASVVLPASVEEAVEFVQMLDNLVSQAPNDAEVRKLVFEADPTLFESLVTFLQAPQVPATDHEALAHLFVALIGMVNRIACKATTPFLGNVLSTALKRHGGVRTLSALIAPSLPDAVRVAASECLFSILLRIDGQRQEVQPEAVHTLLECFTHHTTAPLRAFAAACLRETANANPGVLTDGEAVPALIRCLALDSSADVRGLAAETIDVVFKSDVAFWMAFAGKKELCSAILSRLDREEAPEVLEAVLKLTETLIVTDGMAPGSSSTALASAATVTDHFQTGFLERYLVLTMAYEGGSSGHAGSSRASPRVASLAARCLRLYLQYSPFYRFTAFQICSHFPTFAKLMHVVAQLNQPPAAAVASSRRSGPGSSSSDVAAVFQILRVETSIAVALMLLADPRCRHSFVEQLQGSGWLDDLRTNLLHGLNSAAMEYYGGVAIVDATGQLLNHPAEAVWEGGRPTRTSVQAILQRQEARWQAVDAGSQAATTMDAAEAQRAIESCEDDRATRLGFILLSYAVHSSLSVPSNRGEASQPAAAMSPTRGQMTSESSSTPAMSHPSMFSASLPTKASMLREWKSMPQQAGAAPPNALRPTSAGHYHKAAAGPHHATSPVAAAPPSPVRQAVFNKFDAALSLVTHFAQYFQRPGEGRPVVYETQGGFARRVPTNATWFARPTPGARSWSIDQLTEGDLFYFAIPLSVLSSYAVDQVRTRATRHLIYIKKSFVVTPQTAKARRWFLYDMLNHVMPAIINALTDLLTLFSAYGDENVKFPIVMFRERDTAGSQPDLGAPAVHCGNLLRTIEEARYYFRNASAAPDASTSSQAVRSPISTAADSQYLRDLDAKIKALSSVRFTGNEATFLPVEQLTGGEDGPEDEDVVERAEPRAAQRDAAAASRGSRLQWGGNLSDDDD